MRDMLRVNYTKLSSGECSSKALDTKPERTLLERLVLFLSKRASLCNQVCLIKVCIMNLECSET